MILIFTTFRKKSEAVKIGKDLLKKRLITCYNLVPVESAYLWKGKIVDDSETLMILKTKQVNFKMIESYINKHSSHEVPEVVAIKASKVNGPYLNWINKETK